MDGTMKGGNWSVSSLARERDTSGTKADSMTVPGHVSVAFRSLVLSYRRERRWASRQYEHVTEA
jgi:hypothetical protein